MISQKTSRKISIISFILFIGVMIIHTYNLEVYGIEAQNGGMIASFEIFINKLANGVCVPYFFVISGFLFFRNFDLKMLSAKYRTRSKSILIPYIVWNTIYYLFFACITRLPYLSGVLNSSGETELGIAAYFRYIWEGYYIFWFLRVLIWMILLTPVLYILLKRRKYYWPEIILVILILIALNKTFLPHNLVNAYYVIGAYIGINFRKLPDKYDKRISVAAAVMFPILLALGGIFAGNIIYNCVFIAVSWLALDLFKMSKEVKWWMKCTFFYYCAHDMLLESIEKVILIVFGRSPAMALLDFIAAPALTLLVLIGAAGVLRKFIRPVWKLLSGDR